MFPFVSEFLLLRLIKKPSIPNCRLFCRERNSSVNSGGGEGPRGEGGSWWRGRSVGGVEDAVEEGLANEARRERGSRKQVEGMRFHVSKNLLYFSHRLSGYIIYKFYACIFPKIQELIFLVCDQLTNLLWLQLLPKATGLPFLTCRRLIPNSCALGRCILRATVTPHVQRLSSPCRGLQLLLLLLLLLPLSNVCSQMLPVSNSQLVKFLPGFQGPLPFELETGYVGVGEEEEVQLFYYFVKTERKPEEAPLMLWLTGGPGCSSLTALLYEIGPLNFNIEQYNGSLPTLTLNPYAWTKVSSIIFVDSPVGTGFSYARSSFASPPSDSEQVGHALQFLRKWLVDHPEFMSNPFFVGGDSYSGIPVPVLAQLISDGNQEGVRPAINLQGYILGNPVTVPQDEGNSRITFAHGMGLIPDDLFESLERSCGGEYQTIDPRNAECLKHKQAYHTCISQINLAHILEWNCELVSPKPPLHMLDKRRYLSNKDYNVFSESTPPPTLDCRSYGYLLSEYWTNDQYVREALHIRKGSIGRWQRCSYDIPYEYDIHTSIQFHAKFSAQGYYRSLIYSGDHDMIVPFMATQAWIRSLNYSIVNDWRPWFVKGQVAGYTRTYSNRMTYATVKGAGHTAPEYKPEECSTMYTKWLYEEPL